MGEKEEHGGFEDKEVEVICVDGVHDEIIRRAGGCIYRGYTAEGKITRMSVPGIAVDVARDSGAIGGILRTEEVSELFDWVSVMSG